MKDITAIATPVLGLGGLAFGLWQYYVAQKWKRSEYAAKQLEQLTTDPDLWLFCVLLDWGTRKLPVPERYAKVSQKSVFEHDWKEFGEAIKKRQTPAEYNWQHAMYRDLLDRFCEYLRALNHYVKIGLIDKESIAPIKYWLHKLNQPPYADVANKTMFMDFIDQFDYHDVFRLMERFGVPTRRAPAS
jgi:hypothetical protein